MTPKKKKAKKGGKKKGKDGELTEEDKLKLKTHEVQSLKDNLAFRRDFTRKTKAAYEEMKEKLEETHTLIDEMETTHKASSAYLTHQYKTMQNDMAIKMHQLESELISTRHQLEATENKLDEEIKDKKRIIFEKDEKINDLEQKIHNIQITYDSVMSLTLDNFNLNLDKKKLAWEKSSVQLQTKNKILLAELGLKIHDI